MVHGWADAQSGSTEALPFDVIDLTPTTVVAYRQPESPDHPSIASNLSAAVRISIAPGDSPEGTHLRTLWRQPSFRPSRAWPPISASSAWRGRHDQVPVVGLCRWRASIWPQAENRIIQQLGNKVQEPEVIVDFESPRTRR